MQSDIMKYIDKPAGADISKLDNLSEIFQVELPLDLIEWWQFSDGSNVFWDYKELQFLSLNEILSEDIYDLNKYMPNSIPICLDGNGNICVARIESKKIFGFYVASCSDLGWEESKFIAKTFTNFINDNISPQERLNA